jgi:hypothetical protein
MATTQNTYTGNGSLKNYTFSFPYLEETDIKVSLDGVDTIAYTLANATTVSFNTAPANGAAIRIYRVTNADTPQAIFFAGSAIRAQDLNDNFNQVLYNTQENVNRRINKSGDTMTGDLGFAAGKNIVFEGTTDDAFEATLSGGDPTADRTLVLPNVSGTLVSTGDTGTVATAMIADSNVTTAKIADANVTTAKIADSNVTTAKIADGNVTTAKLNDSAVTTVKIADSNVTTAKIADSNVTTAKIADANVTTVKIADSNVTTSKIADGSVTNAKIADGTITSAKLTGGTVVTNAEVPTVSVNDTSFFTTSASDTRYFRQDSSETITSGATWSGSDSFIATTAAIDARVIDLVDDVGGFVPIANETSFPAANPDVNNGAGTIVSVASIATTRTPSNGSVSIANGSGSNTVTITGCGSTTLESGYGMLVETTSTLHTYSFHRLVPRATEVTTVANNAASITTAATNVADINNFADVYQINNGDPTQRADTTALQVGDLVYRSDTNVIRAYNGTTYQNISPDAATLADIAIVADDLASFEDLGSIADALTAAQSGGALETCADNIADIRTLADIEDGTDATDAIQTVAGIASNVTTVAGVSANVTTVATDIANVNTVAADLNEATSEIETVAGSITNVNNVGNDIGNVNTVAGQISPTNNVGTVAGISSNVSTVAGISSDVTTVAGKATEVETVADNISNVNTTAGSISNVNTVAGSITNVNTVASNISDVNSFADTYTISGSAPGSPSNGDLWYDSVNNLLKFWDGSAWNAISSGGIANLVEDTTPELGGALDCNNNNLTEVGTVSGDNLQIDFGTI